MEPGHGPWYPETRKPVNGPTPSRRRSSVAIAGRTVCRKSARTGLWGRRRVNLRRYPASRKQKWGEGGGDHRPQTTDLRPGGEGGKRVIGCPKSVVCRKYW